MRANGFILPANLTLYGFVAAGVVIAGMALGLYVQGALLKAANAQAKAATVELRTFKDMVAKTTREAERVAKPKEIEHNKLKESVDASHKASLDKQRAASKRVRDANRARGSYLPGTPAAPASADTAKVNRADVDGAIDRFVDGVTGLVGEGDEARLALDKAKEWAMCVKLGHCGAIK
jgi:hypothetical protein